jgi:hypothetical protein
MLFATIDISLEVSKSQANNICFTFLTKGFFVFSQEAGTSLGPERH